MGIKLMAVLLAGALTLSSSAGDIPDVEAAIPAPLKAMGKPALMAFPGGIRMAVSASTEEAQAYVLQGLNHLHGGWEFEASRHFAAALREDPDCLLAHWGMIMCLLNPTPETGDARMAASVRMIALIEQGKGTELERGYTYGLVKYLQEGPAAAANAFRKVAGKFPNDMQAAVLAAIFSRGGFDEAGEATPDQENAEKELMALVDKHPQSMIPLNALLSIHAEAPDLTGILWLSRRLAQMMPDYPPVAHLSGHYEWRCGQHALAATAFGRAVTLSQNWMEENRITLADCPEWVKAESCRIVALASRGELETARAAARKLAATPLFDKRPSSPANRFLLWEAKTLSTRLLLRGVTKGNAKEIAASLPKPTEVEKFRKHSLAYWWIDGLRLAIEARRLLDARDLKGTRDVLDALSGHIESMARSRNLASTGGELSFFNQSRRGLEMLTSELRGELAMAGPTANRGTAYNWFSSAADRQRPATLLMPPVVLTPMAARLGEYHLAAKQPAEAIENYQRALVAFPNDMTSLLGLKRAFEAAGKTAEAEETAKKIEALKVE
jgi:tetratricopeptide (TPR) repeat protein